jgi:hypothetical protein
MNWRRGLLRCWLAASIVWIGVITWDRYGKFAELRDREANINQCFLDRELHPTPLDTPCDPQHPLSIFERLSPNPEWHIVAEPPVLSARPISSVGLPARIRHPCRRTNGNLDHRRISTKMSHETQAVRRPADDARQ